MKKRILLLTAVFLAVVPAVSGAHVLTITEVAPDTFNRYRESRVAGSIYNNGTSSETFDMTLRVTLPNGTTVTVGSRTDKISGGSSRDFSFPIKEDIINDFGTYTFNLTDPDAARNDSLNYEIVPHPTNVINLRNDLITLDGVNEDIPFDVIIKSQSPVDDDPVFSAIPPGSDKVNYSLYRVRENGSNQQLFQSTELYRMNKSDTLTAMINETYFNQQGSAYYRFQANYIIMAPDGTNYTQDVTKTFEVRNAYTYTMAGQLSAVLAAALSAFMLLYVGLNIGRKRNGTGEDDARHGVLRVFFIGAGLAALMAVPFLGGEAVATVNTVSHLSDPLYMAMAITMFVFIVFMFYLLIAYIRNSMMAAAGEEKYEEL